MTGSISIDGILMRWQEKGDGPPLILLHGIPTSPGLWRGVMSGSPTARVLAWEMVGYGSSWAEGMERDISVKAQAGYLSAWMDGLGLRRAILVGHDLGGGIAQILAVNEPERAAGVVLCNAICYDSWPIPSVKAMRAADTLVEKIPVPAFRFVFSSFLRQGHDRQDIANRSIDVHWTNYAHRAGPHAFVRQIRSLNTQDTLEIAGKLPSLDIPAAVVWGAADRFQKISYGRRLSRDLGATIDEIEGGKHFVPEDHPDRVSAAIAAVLDRAQI